ncbi:MAG: DUF177 domain-containing protein [Gemmatimonadetes bacterium]|nr:DUF177 domain-containing protein [Gemmatimonadota bacterium]
MLELDLVQLQREGRVALEGEIPSADPLWEKDEVRLTEPVRVRLQAQQVGADVLVRGHITTALELPCRRCLEPVVLRLDEPVTFLFRHGVADWEAVQEEAYPLPERAQELDLRQPVREHLLLARPQFALCAEQCQGLCPHCGANWNQGRCECRVEEQDERWAPLRRLLNRE